MTNKTWSQTKSRVQLTFIVPVNQIENHNKKIQLAWSHNDHVFQWYAQQHSL